MKKTILTSAILFLCVITYAQDSITKPRLLLRPFFECGANFLRNDVLKQNYATQSMYVWSAGLQIGFPGTSQMIPYLQFSSSSFGIKNRISPNSVADSVLSIKQGTCGVILPFKIITDVYLRARFGYTYSAIKESFYKIDASAHGFQIGIGAEWRISGSSRIYSDFVYNYQKTERSSFSDFDVTRLSIGFVF